MLKRRIISCFCSCIIFPFEKCSLYIFNEFFHSSLQAYFKPNHFKTKNRRPKSVDKSQWKVGHSLESSCLLFGHFICPFSHLLFSQHSETTHLLQIVFQRILCQFEFVYFNPESFKTHLAISWPLQWDSGLAQSCSLSFSRHWPPLYDLSFCSPIPGFVTSHSNWIDCTQFPNSSQIIWLLSCPFWPHCSCGCDHRSTLQSEVHGPDSPRSLYCLESTIVCWILLHLFCNEQVS